MTKKIFLSLLFVISAFLVRPSGAYAAACPVTDGGAGDGDSTVNGTIRISSSTTWSATAENLGEFDCSSYTIHITNNATLTLASFTNNDSTYNDDYGVSITATNVTLDSGSTISADSRGYAGGVSGSTTGKGPGGGNPGGNAAGGGAYGGNAGNGANGNGGFGTGGSAYGSTPPIMLGSGGGFRTVNTVQNGSAGGGAIKINASGAVSLEGTTTASGGTNGRGGGGAGGSIWIIADTLSGAGSVIANGGFSGIGGGGGGGRILIEYGSSTYSGSVTVSGGGSTLGGAGGVGSALLVDTTNNDLTIQTSQIWNANPSFENSTHTYRNVTVTNNSTWTLQAYNTSSTGSDGVGFIFNVENFTVESGSTISGDSRGYIAGPSGTMSGRGPGGGTGGNVSAGGGGHGGKGGIGDAGQAGGNANDSATSPILPGSGGGRETNNNGAAGGGAIKIDAAETVSIPGTITMDGGGAGRGGGGAGGSIWIIANTVTGNGTLSADGGFAGIGGGGGGGRIAIDTTLYNFSGTTTISGGGSTLGTAGASGTLELIAPPFPRIGYQLKASIDEFKIYNFEKTADQMKADFAARGSNEGASAVLGSNSQKFLSDGLVGYWKMDEASANTCTGGTNDSCDSSGNGLNGAWTGNTSTTTGKFGSGTSYDGTGDYTQLSNSSLLDPDTSTGDFVLSAWFKTGTSYPSGSNSSGYIYNDYGSDTDNLIRLSIGDGSSSVLDCAFRDAAGNSVTVRSTSTVNSNTWRHAVCVKKGPTVTLYLDGTEVDSETNISFSTITVSDGSNPRIGSYAEGTDEIFTGSLDEVRVYNRALSENEVQALYNWAPGPIGYWNMDEGSGTTAFDRSGSGNTGTVTNATWANAKFGNGLSFDGSGDYVDIGSGPTVVNTVSFWTNPATTTEYFIDMNGSAYISSSGGTLSATGFTNPTIYVNGVASSTISAGIWQHVTVTASAVNASDFDIGRIEGVGDMEGKIDDVKFYNYIRTSGQIIEDMNGGHPIGGSPIGSMVAHYRFDEQSGQTANNSGNQGSTINGTLGASSGTSTDDPTWKTKNECKVNGCLSFDGGDKVITTDNSSVHMTNSSSISFSAWVKPTTISGLDNIIRYDDDDATDGDSPNSRNFYILRLNDGAPQFQFGPSTGLTTINGTALAAGSWYHIVGVRNVSADTASIYVNGKLAATGTDVTTGSWETTGQYLMVGAYSDGSVNEYFDGLIDEVKVYNTALTEEQVRIDMNAGSTITFGGTANSEASSLSDGAGNPPIAYWNMDEKTGSSVNDTSGNGNTGTITGATWTRGQNGGSALNFDGDNDLVEIADTDTLSFTSNTAQISFSAWIYLLSGSTADKAIVSKYDSQNNEIEYAFFVDAPNRELNLFLSENGTAGSVDLWKISTANNVISYDKWHHVVVTADIGTGIVNFFVDGTNYAQEEDQLGDIVNLQNLTEPVRIGAMRCGNGSICNNWNGMIDQVKIYDYKLTNAQVTYDYNRGAPVAHWRFDECEGTTAHDVSGNGLNGTITPGASGNTAAGNCTSGTSTHMWNDGATGKFNASMGFDGTDDYVIFSDMTNSYITVAAWNYLTKTDPGGIWGGPIISKDNTTSGVRDVNVYWQWNSGVLSLFCDLSLNGTAVTQTSYNPNSSSILNQWTHAACTYDGSNARLYLNGTQVAISGTISGTLVNTATAWYVGTRSNGDIWYQGQIDDVRIYNYALSESQIKNVMNNASSVFFGPSQGTP